jgi:uncharacterized protein YjbI with pentapeptide repeats
MDITGEPRSVAEMEFVAGLHACEACGDARPLDWRVGGEGTRWMLRAACPRCATPRQFVFHSARDLIAAPHGRLELGGAEPSAILSPAELVAEIDRLAPSAARDPSDLDGDAWYANSALVDRVLTALTELHKFVPADELVIPQGGYPDQLLRPERYTRAWIRDQLVQWEVVAAVVAADAPRIFAADRMLTRGTPARGRIDATSLDAHATWLAGGKVGEGRLDVVVSDAEGYLGEGVDLAASKLEAVRLRRADLRSARFDGAELDDVDLRGAQLDAATLSGAQLHGCWFDGAELDSATLDRVRMDACVLDAASLVRTRWRAAHTTTTSFRGARFVHAQLDRARFIDCDFRGASFAALAAGAVFERCDFRGASLEGCDLTNAHLVHCKLAGAYGNPAATDGMSVVYADFSETGDGSDLGDLEDLLDELAD